MIEHDIDATGLQRREDRFVEGCGVDGSKNLSFRS